MDVLPFDVKQTEAELLLPSGSRRRSPVCLLSELKIMRVKYLLACVNISQRKDEKIKKVQKKDRFIYFFGLLGHLINPVADELRKYYVIRINMVFSSVLILKNILSKCLNLVSLSPKENMFTGPRSRLMSGRYQSRRVSLNRRSSSRSSRLNSDLVASRDTYRLSNSIRRAKCRVLSWAESSSVFWNSILLSVAHRGVLIDLQLFSAFRVLFEVEVCFSFFFSHSVVSFHERAVHWSRGVLGACGWPCSRSLEAPHVLCHRTVWSDVPSRINKYAQLIIDGKGSRRTFV